MLRILMGAVLAVGVAGCAVKPKPFTLAENIDRASMDIAELEVSSPPPSKPISMEEAQARAVTYNLDHRLQMFNAALQNKQLDLTKLDMLPSLTANAGYVARDRDLVSSSASYQSGVIQPSNFQTVSVDRERVYGDLTLSWNAIDFGVSYLQAKQQADRVEIAREQRRRVVNNIFQQVRATYWTAVAAERVRPRIKPILAEARRALATSRALEAERAQEPLEALRYQRALIELIQELESIDDKLAISKTQLSQLMGLRPGTPFELAMPMNSFAVQPIRFSLDDMEAIALVNRPELREEGYNARIAKLEGRKALLRLVPGVTLLGSLNYDSNSYLLFDQWKEGGTRVTASLLRLASVPAVRKLNKAQTEIADTRRLAVTMAVLAQVQISAQQYRIALKNYEGARTLAAINRKIAGLSQDTADAQTTSDLALIWEKANAALSELARNRAYADLQNADAYISVTLGLDPLPDGPLPQNLDALAVGIKERANAWRSGNVPIPVLEAAEPAGKVVASATPATPL